MAVYDKNLQMVSAQAFTSSGAVATNSLPLVVTGLDVAATTPMAMVFTVTTAALVAGTETYLFRVQTATNADGTTGAQIIATTPTYTVASGTFAQLPTGNVLAAGEQIVVFIPPFSIPATATHITGYVVLGASGGISCTIDLRPLSHCSFHRAKYADNVTFI